MTPLCKDLGPILFPSLFRRGIQMIHTCSRPFLHQLMDVALSVVTRTSVVSIVLAKAEACITILNLALTRSVSPTLKFTPTSRHGTYRSQKLKRNFRILNRNWPSHNGDRNHQRSNNGRRNFDDRDESIKNSNVFSPKIWFIFSRQPPQ